MWVEGVVVTVGFTVVALAIVAIAWAGLYLASKFLAPDED